MITACWLMLSLWGCGGHAAEAEAPAGGPVTIAQGLVDLPEASRTWLRTEVVGEGAQGLPIDGPARVEAVAEARIRLSAPVQGVVERIWVAPGQKVEPGDDLVELRSPEAARRRLEEAHAQARVEAAQAEQARQDKLLGEGIGRKAEVLGAAVALAEARVALGEARAAVKALGTGRSETVTLRAARGGRIGALVARPGQWVGPDAGALVEVVSGERLQAVVDLKADDADLVQHGDPGVVTIPGFGEVRGEIVNVGGEVDPDTGRVPVLVDLFADKELRSGQRAQARLSGRMAGHPSVEVGAVILRPDRSRALWVEVAAGRYQRRTVTVGRIAGGRAEILTGVAPGERVVCDGALLLDESAERML